MSDQFIAIGTNGNKVSRNPTRSLGVVPIITTRYLFFDDMTWDDIERVSNRAVYRSSCYVPRLGEKKDIVLKNDNIVKASLVGIRKSFLKNGGSAIGFTFQVVDGLAKSLWSDSLQDEMYELLPDDLKKVIKPTYDGTIWLPKQANIIGPIAQKWYDYYMYHNSKQYRIATDIYGNPLGYWTSSSTLKGRYVIGSDGDGFFSDSNEDSYGVSICFAV